MDLLVLAFLVLLGPLALLFGADSRVDDPRGWWPALPRRPAPGLPPPGYRARLVTPIEPTAARRLPQRHRPALAAVK